MVKGIAPKLKWNKKRWFSVQAPALFNEADLGNTVGYEEKDVLGRTIRTNASLLTNDPRKQTRKFTFKINQVKGDRATTILKSYELMESHIKRLIRKNGSRIDIITTTPTKDGKNVTVKVLLLTTSQCTANQRKDLRAKGMQSIKTRIVGLEYDAFVTSILQGALQKDIKNDLKKVHPLKVTEVLKYRVAA
ncbi:hypothetical protein COT72_00230 [archaeon CG10_big_fil_rev_8_21_14_0_10_43_11]|nr:MAG: hypothetical protein COT72_00230 [archaeon CG10_big_fil_rev_8_21_14_0_10_43_11]